MNLYLLMVRCCLSAVFLFSGVDKVLQWTQAQQEVAALGLPMPSLLALATIVVQLLGGLLVLLGVYLRLGCLLLMSFTVLATLLAHWPLGAPSPIMALTTSLEHVAILGGFAALMLLGPGAYRLPQVAKPRLHPSS
ncbi:DoxX family protein [Gallaecimonas mangrovi]|uniref:DoxX family protein n=1 Tax=Gallaecimonas mangrovi TaxID=2291597 RepID=UPI000E202B93|nr:DoxX family protein [Gallaecimonas mangrovi]